MGQVGRRQVGRSPPTFQGLLWHATPWGTLTCNSTRTMVRRCSLPLTHTHFASYPPHNPTVPIPLTATRGWRPTGRDPAWEVANHHPRSGQMRLQRHCDRHPAGRGDRHRRHDGVGVGRTLVRDRYSTELHERCSPRNANPNPNPSNTNPNSNPSNTNPNPNPRLSSGCPTPRRLGACCYPLPLQERMYELHTEQRRHRQPAC